jgi:hypothetical protein
MKKLVALGLSAGLCASIGCKTAEPITDQPPAANTQDTSELGPAAKMWAGLDQPASMIEFFNGTFETMAITLDSGESFTVRHTGTAFEFLPGALEDANFAVPLKQENIENVLKYTEDGQVDPQEATNMMAVLFTPLTQVILNHPITRDPDLREKSEVEELIHTYLVGPDGADVAVHTMKYENEAWTVTPGADGEPKRVFRIKADEAVEYQRRAFKALKTNSPLGWLEFINWYKEWREGVSTVPAST